MGRRKKSEIQELQKKWEMQETMQGASKKLNGVDTTEDEAAAEPLEECKDDDEETVFNGRNACGQRGCFSYRDGHCHCLGDTDFNGRACPFFKTVKQYEDDLTGASMPEDPIAEEDEPTGLPEGEENKPVCAASAADFLSANAALMDELEELEKEAGRIVSGEGGTLTGEGDMDDGWDDE